MVSSIERKVKERKGESGGIERFLHSTPYSSSYCRAEVSSGAAKGSDNHSISSIVSLSSTESQDRFVGRGNRRPYLALCFTMQVHMQQQKGRRSKGGGVAAAAVESSEFCIRVEDLHCGPMVGGIDWLKRLFKGADIGSIILPGHSSKEERRNNFKRAKSASHAELVKVSHVFPLAADPPSISLREPPSFRNPPPAFRITGMHLW